MSVPVGSCRFGRLSAACASFGVAALAGWMLGWIVLGDRPADVGSAMGHLAVVALLMLPGLAPMFAMKRTRTMVIFATLLTSLFPLSVALIRLGPGGSQDGVGLLLVPFAAVTIGAGVVMVEHGRLLSR